jgi:hypothetical protein
MLCSSAGPGHSTLNAFMALEPESWAAARATVTDLLSAADGASRSLRDDPTLQAEALVPVR